MTIQSTFNEGPLTYQAGEDLEAYRRVKIESGTTTNPPEVVYADAGELCHGVTMESAKDGDPILVKELNAGGSFLVEAGEAIVEGADCYGANDGKLSDSVASGPVQFVARMAASGTGAIIECVLNPYLATSAANVSIADAGNKFTGATVELALQECADATTIDITDTASIFTATEVNTALQEVMQGIKTAQYTLSPQKIVLETGADVGAFANGATDGWAQMSNKEVVLRWNDGGTPTDMVAIFTMPQDLDDSANVIVHLLGAIVKAGADEADSPVITCEAYFTVAGADPAADADAGGDSGEFLTTADAAFQEKTLTIAAANVPASPSQLTLVFHPKDGQLGTDDFIMCIPWLEVTRKALTS